MAAGPWAGILNRGTRAHAWRLFLLVTAVWRPAAALHQMVQSVMFNLREYPILSPKGWCMTKKKAPSTSEAVSFAQARDELFSHILRCGVIDALPEHQKDWFDDTMGYVADRYEDLSDEELAQLRTLGERYCQPVRRVETVESGAA
jgi:hypothetical protein